jgi:ABC-2 type transport system ATP-binding protein
VAATEIRRRIRNRSALLTAVVAPLAMAVVFGLLLGGTDSLSITIGVVDSDRSELTTGYVDGLLASNGDDSPVEFVAVTDDAGPAIATIVAAASGTGIAITGIEVHEPNLEAVFLHLTGRALRDRAE